MVSDVMEPKQNDIIFIIKKRGHVVEALMVESKPTPSRIPAELKRRKREREEKDRRYLADSYKAEAHPY